MKQGAISKRILLQGSTGSIGKSTLDVVRAHAISFRIVGLAVRASVNELLDQINEFHPESVAINSVQSETAVVSIIRAMRGKPVYIGPDAVVQQAAEAECDIMVNAMSGSAGLEATDAALRRSIPVALANKETLVAAGPLMMKCAADAGTRILPIDSEHSAIFQCLIGEDPDSIRKIWLTTSGGPFRHRRFSELNSVSVAEALHHPTWQMGPKITIDSATLFNKGLEVIEVERLFGVPVEKIGVVIHPQSVVHSLVEFVDGSIKAQLSTPNMKLPILYALSYPERLPSNQVQTMVDELGTLTFEPVRVDEFPCLACAFEALRKGGTAPAAVSAADEVAVPAFLDQEIRFTDIPIILNDVLDAWPKDKLANLVQVRQADQTARMMAGQSINRVKPRTPDKLCC